VLVDSGVITKNEVIEVLEIRTLDIIYDLFIWKVGTFEFCAAGPLPADFTRVHVEPNRVVMEGVYRSDEMSRFQTLIPSDRTVMELGSGWTSSVGVGKTTRQLLYFLEKRMTVAEISYNMHSSPFEVYGQLYELVQKGLARVSGELPETSEPEHKPPAPDQPEDLLTFASRELDQGRADKALSAIHTVLEREPNNEAAHALLVKAEQKVIAKLYQEMSPAGVPKIVISTEELANKEIGPQEGFVLSRINGEWDVQSILSICPFREADSLGMIKKLLDKGIIGF
jgi:predicted ArsR family transcriptional regulator